jgi:hypothetical protein
MTSTRKSNSWLAEDGDELTVGKAVAVAEFLALCIGLVMPISPTRGGASSINLAQWLIEEPSYFQQVLVFFILTNVVLALLAGLAAGLWWLEKRRYRS